MQQKNRNFDQKLLLNGRKLMKKQTILLFCYSVSKSVPFLVGNILTRPQKIEEA